MGCVLQGVTSESFVYECALRVLIKGGRNDGRGDDSYGHDGEVRKRCNMVFTCFKTAV